MSTRTKMLFIGAACCLLGAGFGSAPVLFVGIALVLVGLAMHIGGRL